MNYPGNSALSADIRERILSTFEQTRALAAKGSTQEALLGCDFILRMDPAFEVAQVLQARLRTTDGPVEVDDLATASQAREAEVVEVAQEGVLDLGDVEVLDDTLSNLADSSDLAVPLAEGIQPDALKAAFQDLLANRELQRLVKVADQHKEEVAANAAIRKLVTTAYTRLEAEPYVLEFLTGARQAMDAGNAEEARTLLEKARSLDVSHPGIEKISRLREMLRQSSSAPSAAAGTPIEEESDFGTLLTPKSPPPAAPVSSTDLAAEAIDFASVGEPVPSVDAFEVDQGPTAAPSDAGGDNRISQLLDEGQAAFDSGSYQVAIDSWSRIFLIDIDHEEAARRIDFARQHRAEDERRVEELFSDAINAFDTGNLEASKEGFEEVLRLNPSHVAAREYLEQVERGPEPVLDSPPTASGVDLPPIALDSTASSELPLPGVMIPPDGPVATPPPVPVHTGGAGSSRGTGGAWRKFVMLGAPVLLVLAAVGWYGWQHRADFFPNSNSEETADSPGGDPVGRATQLHESGKTALALRILRRVSAVEAHYEEAQALISQWQEEDLSVAADDEAEDLGEQEAQRLQAEQQRGFLVAGREAFRRKRNLVAVDQFRRAQRLGPLALADAQQLDQAVRLLTPLKKQLEFFRQGEWEVVIPTLWRMREDDPTNQDIQSLMVDSYYNLAIRDLQRGDAGTAAQRLAEAHGLDPDDRALERHHLFAKTYSTRPKDLQYWIYTKYLPSR